MKSNPTEIIFTPLSAQDLPLLHQWFQDPQVKRWYARNQVYTLEQIQQKYLPRINDPTIPNYAVSVDNKLIGYIQYYLLTHYFPEGVSDFNHPLFLRYKPEDLVGIDLFIGEECFLHRGYGCQLLQEFITKFLHGNFHAAVVDPAVDNVSAIAFFEKCGFKQILEQPQEAGNLLLIFQL